jgi:dethiobiotin synthetase
MTRRLFFVGTDTHAGKTQVVCALLQAAARAGVIAIPFKPVESGPGGPNSDHARLLAASILTAKEVDELAPMRWPEPIAPGLADDPTPFLGLGPGVSDLESMLGRARWALARLEGRHEAQVSLIEGAGGLLVPMPGGSWVPDWIVGLRAAPIIVARAGLGTINHTLLTIEALRVREIEPIGFLFTQLLARDDPSRAHNGTVIEQRSGVPCLGTLPFLGRPPTLPASRSADEWLVPDFWTRVLAS